MHEPVPAGSGGPPASGWPDAEVSVRLRRGAGAAVRVEGQPRRAPLWTRWDGDTLWLVGSGASPVGEDSIRLRVDVGPGVSAAVRSVAATVIYAARGAGTRWDTEIHVAAGATLDWRPEPVVLTERARHRSTTTVHAAAGAQVALDEVVVLGRAAEALGALTSTLTVRVDHAPVLLTSIDTSLPGWSGPAGAGQASVVAHRLCLGGLDAPTPERMPPDTVLLRPGPGCRLGLSAGRAVGDTRRSLNEIFAVGPSNGDEMAFTETKQRGNWSDIHRP